jgi:hypothetical protein
MARSRRTDLVIVALALAVAVLAAAAVVVLGSNRSVGRSVVSRGEAIFQAGVDANGNPIPRSGGGMMGGGMMVAGCATCHGPDGHGRTTPMFTSPNITYGNLTDPQGMLQPDGTRGATYTDATLRTAVTQGLDPEGSRLQSPMPQWQLTSGQWGDLLVYLKTLK